LTVQFSRRTIRYLAAVPAIAMAIIYYLIGLEVLHVVVEPPESMSLFWFGIPAGSAFLLGAVLLVVFDRRILWILGAVLQVLVALGYLAVAADRTPAYEVWGITLRIIQVPLFAFLVYLAMRAPGSRRVERRAIRRQ
jgi:hypothetical protein